MILLLLRAEVLWVPLPRDVCEFQLPTPSHPPSAAFCVPIIPSFLVGWWHLLQEALHTPKLRCLHSAPEGHAHHQLSAHPSSDSVSLAYLLSRWGSVIPGLELPCLCDPCHAEPVDTWQDSEWPL